MSDDARIVEIEIKLSYAEQRVADLDETVLEQSRRIDQLEETVRLLRVALTRMAQTGEGEVLGAMPEDDPVPNSG
jgi:uncharacterized coiled-coil protein SlyX